MNASDPTGEELLQGAVNAAIKSAELPEPDAPEPEGAASMLRAELQRVLQLPRGLRQCFVLRVLLGLSPKFARALLRFDADQVDESACSAMSELAGLRPKGFSPV